MQDKEEERTLVSVENRLTKEGFAHDFKITNGRLHTLDPSLGKSFAPDEVTIVDFYRFEGESNPDDMAILYAIEAHDGTKGTIAASYGTYADTDTDDFLKKVEDLGKKIDR